MPLLSLTDTEVNLLAKRARKGQCFSGTSHETEAMIEEKAAAKGLEVRYFTSGKDATLPVDEWLAYFCDASYVITDSFHGSVFAKMFGRPCEVIRNPKRGGSRFDYLDKGVDFNDLRESGLAFLKDALSGKTDKR